MNITVREAAPDDRLGVRRVLDAAMLDVRDDLRERVESGDVLVAMEDDGEETPVLGALVLVPDAERIATVEATTRERSAHGDERAHGDASAHVDAVAVRRARRGQGIGSALVRAAIERRSRLTAEFDVGVRPFYESLGFEIESVEGDDDRFRGRYS